MTWQISFLCLFFSCSETSLLKSDISFYLKKTTNFEYVKITHTAKNNKMTFNFSSMKKAHSNKQDAETIDFYFSTCDRSITSVFSICQNIIKMPQTNLDTTFQWICTQFIFINDYKICNSNVLWYDWLKLRSLERL